MTYSQQIGTERIKDDAITDAKIDSATVPSLGGNQTYTGSNVFESGVEVKDSDIDITQTGATDPVVKIDTSGQYSISNGFVAPIVAFSYDAFNAGLLMSAKVRFQNETRFENLNFYSPNSTIRFYDQTSVTHALIQTEQAAAGGPIYELQVDGKHRWGVDGGGYDAELYRSAAGELKTDTKLVVGTDLQVDGDVALGNAITDLIGMYGAAAVAQAAAISAPSAPSAGYVQAEAQSAVDAINDIIAALAGIGITA